MSSLRTPIGILSFPRVFSPRPRAQGGEPVFQVNLLFDRTAQAAPEFAALRRAVADAIDEAFGADKHKDKQFVAGLRLPFRRCAEKKYKGYDIENGVYIAPWSKSRPGVVNAQRQEITVPEDVWAGQMARATVAAFAYNNSGNKGVSFALNNLQICRTDTERLDGRVAAEDDFDEYGDAGNALVDEDAPF
jgi:hypothetical protein